MKTILFAGPTLDRATIASRLDADLRGPVSFGDVYRATEQRPCVIAIIDGYFDRVAAVWHKEILWAMTHGIHVLGAASMGALRAAELADFGMVGVGRIFHAFASGELSDDDEVAVTHADAQAGFLPSSEAMVNIRATLDRAVEAEVIDQASNLLLQQLGKARFYPERSFAQLLADAAATGIHPDVLGRLRVWLPEGRFDAKRADALELLELLRRWSQDRPEPLRVSYRFNATDAWHEATRLARRDAGGQASSELDGMLEELKLDGLYPAVWQAAAARGAALELARAAGVRPDSVATRGALEQLRREQSLLDAESVPGWLAQQHLSELDATRFFEDQARLAWARPLHDDMARRHLVDQLRESGLYGSLRARAAAKRMQPLEPTSVVRELARLGLAEAELWRRYFVDRLSLKIPADIDAYARKAGFRDIDELRFALVKDEVHRQKHL